MSRLEHWAGDNRLSKIRARAEAISEAGTCWLEGLARAARRGEMETVGEGLGSDAIWDWECLDHLMVSEVLEVVDY